jgi:hypothetical protein
MGTKHKHYDVIVAWAAGEEVEFKSTECANWQNWKQNHAPSFHRDLEWRIKPQRVKKEGWVNVYKDDMVGHTNVFFRSKDDADYCAEDDRVACVRIEWEEEV